MWKCCHIIVISGVIVCCASSMAQAIRPTPGSTDGATLAVQRPAELDSQAIRDAARRVMNGSDFRSVRRRVLENIPESDADKGFLDQMFEDMGNSIEDFFDWLFTSSSAPNRRRATSTGSSSSASGSGLSLGFAQILLFLAIVALIAVAIWIISVVVKSSDGQRNGSKDFLNVDDDDLADLSVPPGELAALTYESRALQFAADGNFRAAIRELLLGSMSWVERSGFIRFRKGLTNRDYIRAVWRQEHRRQSYTATAAEFELVYFGRRTATREMFESCLNHFQGAFREEETTT